MLRDRKMQQNDAKDPIKRCKRQIIIAQNLPITNTLTSTGAIEQHIKTTHSNTEKGGRKTKQNDAQDAMSQCYKVEGGRTKQVYETE